MCRPAGGSGAGAAVVAVAVCVAGVGGGALMVAHAVAEMMPVLIGAEVMVAVAVVSLVVWRVMALFAPTRAAVRGDNDRDMVRVNSWRHQPVVAAPQRRAELPPAGRHEHIHFHGLSPQDVAAIVAARKEI